MLVINLQDKTIIVGSLSYTTIITCCLKRFKQVKNDMTFTYKNTNINKKLNAVDFKLNVRGVDLKLLIESFETQFVPWKDNT